MDIQNLKRRAKLFLKAKYYKVKYGNRSMVPQCSKEEYVDYMMKNLGFYQVDPIKYQKRVNKKDPDYKLPEYWFDTDRFRLYFVTLDDIDVGYFAFRIHENGIIAKVKQVHITERERGNGLGRITVLHMEKLAKSLGVERMYAFDREKKFWEKMGYNETGSVCSELMGISYDEDETDRSDGFMVKNL
jgi:GNAT superfamily N-acetyltransferase